MFGGKLVQFRGSSNSASGICIEQNVPATDIYMVADIAGGKEAEVFENMVLRRIFGPRRDEVTGELEEILNDLYSSPIIVRMIKSRRMRWVGHVARMGEERVCIGETGGKETNGET